MDINYHPETHTVSFRIREKTNHALDDLAFIIWVELKFQGKRKHTKRNWEVFQNKSGKIVKKLVIDIDLKFEDLIKFGDARQHCYQTTSDGEIKAECFSALERVDPHRVEASRLLAKVPPAPPKPE